MYFQIYKTVLTNTLMTGSWHATLLIVGHQYKVFCFIFTVSVDILHSMKKPRLVCFLKSWRRSTSSTLPSGMISLSLVSIQ